MAPQTRPRFSPEAVVEVSLSKVAKLEKAFEVLGDTEGPVCEAMQAELKRATVWAATFDSHCGEEDWCCASWRTFTTGIAERWSPLNVPLLWEVVGARSFRSRVSSFYVAELEVPRLRRPMVLELVFLVDDGKKLMFDAGAKASWHVRDCLVSLLCLWCAPRL